MYSPLRVHGEMLTTGKSVCLFMKHSVIAGVPTKLKALRNLPLSQAVQAAMKQNYSSRAFRDETS
jgi:hypothetical protein